MKGLWCGSWQKTVILAVRWGLTRRVEEYLLQIELGAGRTSEEVMWLRRMLGRVK